MRKNSLTPHVFHKKMVNLFNGLISIFCYKIIVIITILIKKHKRNFIKIYCIVMRGL
jgi:hypothetical protein